MTSSICQNFEKIKVKFSFYNSKTNMTDKYDQLTIVPVDGHDFHTTIFMNEEQLRQLKKAIEGQLKLKYSKTEKK